MPGRCGSPSSPRARPRMTTEHRAPRRRRALDPASSTTLCRPRPRRGRPWSARAHYTVKGRRGRGVEFHEQRVEVEGRRGGEHGVEGGEVREHGVEVAAGEFREQRVEGRERGRRFHHGRPRRIGHAYAPGAVGRARRARRGRRGVPRGTPPAARFAVRSLVDDASDGAFAASFSSAAVVALLSAIIASRSKGVDDASSSSRVAKSANATSSTKEAAARDSASSSEQSAAATR